MRTHVLLCTTALSLLTSACQAAGPETEQTGKALPAYPNTFQYQDKDLLADDAVKADVMLGSRRHYYSFFADAGQAVQFRLAFHSPESDRRGAEIWVYDGDGVLLAHSVDWWGLQVATDVTFPATDEYFVYVSHVDWWGFDYDERFPYQLHADWETGLCAEVKKDLTDATPQEGFFAKNYAWHEVGAAWAWVPDAAQDDPVVWRTVRQGQCRDHLEHFECDAADPPVCCAGIWFYGTAPHACACRDYIRGQAGTHGSEMGAYTEGICQ